MKITRIYANSMKSRVLKSFKFLDVDLRFEILDLR